MSDSRLQFKLPPEQQAIRAKCFHPSGMFAEFPKEDIEKSIPERFEKIVCTYPSRIAIRAQDRSITYAELNAMANQIAHEILEKYGEGSRPVGILMQHGASILAAILGVLKAGKLYVPLDPTYPEERLRYILLDVGAELLITHDETHNRARKLTEQLSRCLNVDDIEGGIGMNNPKVCVSPDTLAYILYTSGSTGRPKGVVDNHRNLLHGTLRFTNAFHLCRDDRISFTHSCSTSASVRRIFPALLNGASLFPFDVKREGVAGLFDFITDEGITIFGTGRIREFVRNLDCKRKLSSVRLCSFGGEVVHRRDVELYRKIFPPQCLIGIWMSCTETGNITQFLMDGESRIDGDIVPIGYPAEDIEVLLLDDTGDQVSAGEVGEIVIKSDYLAIGYWNRDDLTSERFHLDPHERAKRLYITGDLGRRDADGCLFHLGRKDDQVKIRGHRVETAEVAGALFNLGYFSKAFVAARNRGSEQSLIAYLVPERRPAPTASSLRKALAAVLPDPMIPSRFVILDELPLTATRKVDRTALPDPGNTRPELDVPFVAPTTPVQQCLAQFWSEILAIDNVGIHDNFFDLGGNSLAATRVVSQVIKTFQLELPVKTLFQSPTVAEMALMIMQHDVKTLNHEDLQRMLTELEAMSESEAERHLAKAGSLRSRADRHE